jgi:hypothetical protein
MTDKIHIEGRDSFILFGTVLARILHQHDPDKQWIISLEDAPDSGKSLLALAADYLRNPGRYHPHGLLPEINVNSMLALAIPSRGDVFFDMGFSFLDKYTLFEDWAVFTKKNFGTKLFYVSNVSRLVRLENEPEYNPSYKDVVVDMRIGVAIGQSENFSRIVALNCFDKDVQAKIVEAFKQAQPSPPIPKSLVQPQQRPFGAG